MRIRQAGVIAGVGFFSAVGVCGDLIEIRAQVHEINADGTRGRSLAAATLAVPEGEWATFEDIKQYLVPENYEPAQIPDGKKGVLGGGVKEAVTYKGMGEAIPPHPIDFKPLDIGLKLKFRPTLNKDGSIKTECIFKETKLEGFEPTGTPITEDVKVPFKKKPRTIVVLNNWKQKPVLKTREASLEFRAQKPGPGFGLTATTDPRSSDAYITPKSKDEPKIFVTVRAEKMQFEDQAPKAGPDAHIYLVTRAIEVQPKALKELNVQKLLHDKTQFSDSEFQILIRALNQQKGTDLLTAPAIMMRNNQQGKIEVIRELTFPIAYEAPKFAFESDVRHAGTFPVTPAKPVKFTARNIGPTVVVTGRNVGKGLIELDLEPEIIEFDSNQNFGEPIFTHVPNAFQKLMPVVLTENRIEMPVIKRQKLKTTVRVADGNTIMIGGFSRVTEVDVEDKVPILGDLPLIGKLGRKQYTETNERLLFWFFTPRLQDPAGLSLAE